ncbi:MAG: response regulator [Janthinobacterium lividum]
MYKLASVLLIDDDPITNFLHEQLLVSLGVTDHCLIAENGVEALAQLAELGDAPAPALVLLDVHMPVMGGVDFLEAFVQPPSAPPVIIILSTSEHPHDQSRLATLPVADWITKPLTQEKIQHLLRQHFPQHLMAA